MRREGTGCAAVLSAALLLAAPAGAATQAVTVQFAAFAPSQVAALPGDTVEWANASPRTHTVTGAAFASGDLAPDARFAWSAGPPGAYPYHCTIHPEMTGEVAVRVVTL